MRAWLKVRILTVYRRQGAFAKAIKMSDVRLSRIVNGKANPTDEEKALIARKLGVGDIEVLFSMPKGH